MPGTAGKKEMEKSLVAIWGQLWKKSGVKFIRRECLWLLGLALAISFLWMLRYDRFTLANWSAPPTHGGDSYVMMGLIKSYADGEFVPFLPKTNKRLGAPFGASWDDFPLPEELLLFFLGRIAKWFGIAAAANVAVLLLHLTAGLSFYVCGRYLRYARAVTMAGAMLYAFAYFHLWRSLPHMLVAYSYTIPLGLLTCWLVGGSRRLHWKSKPFWICVCCSALLGISNPYNLNMFLQLLVLTLAVHFLTVRRQENLKIGALCFCVAVVSFIAVNLDTLIYQFQNGKNSEAMFRAYFQSELYSLKPIDLVVPPPEHNIGLLGRLGQWYSASAWLKGELFAPYLGWVAIAGLIWLVLESLGVAVGRRCPRRFPVPMLQVIWVFLYSVVGGLNCLLAMSGFVLFRSTNRYSIFLSALALMFLVSRLSRVSRGWSSGLRWGLAVIVTGIGLVDQVSIPAHIGKTGYHSPAAQMMRSDAAFAEAMEAKLPKNAMVFQLPLMDFPEAGNVVNAEQDEYFRPYFSSKTLRFAFGNLKGCPRDGWQREVERMPPQQMVATLERYGFGAIYLCRKGFADNGEGLLKQLAGLGKDQIIEDDLKEHVCVILNPSAKPELPESGDQALVNYKAGWSVTERTAGGLRRWTSGNARLEFFNARSPRTAYSVRCQVGSPNARQVAIRFKGKEVWRASLGAGQTAAVDIVVEAERRNNVIEFVTDTSPIPASPNSPTMIAFAVIDLKISRISGK